MTTTLSTVEPLALCWVRSLSEMRKLHCNPYAGANYFSNINHHHFYHYSNWSKVSSSSHSSLCWPAVPNCEWFLLFGHKSKMPCSWVFTLLNQPLISSPLQFLIVRVYLIQPTMKIPFFSWRFLITICSLFVNFGIFVVSDQCLHDQRDLLIGFEEQPQIR